MKKIIFLLVLAAGIIYFSMAGRTTIGPHEAGVLIGPGHIVTVFKAGQHPIVLPVVTRLLRLSTKPIIFAMAGVGAVNITIGKTSHSVNCLLRYQLHDPRALVDTYGTKDPQTNLGKAFRHRVVKILTEQLTANPDALATAASRVPLLAELHSSLNETFAPEGIQIISFEFLSWKP